MFNLLFLIVNDVFVRVQPLLMWMIQRGDI